MLSRHFVAFNSKGVSELQRAVCHMSPPAGFHLLEGFYTKRPRRSHSNEPVFGSEGEEGGKRRSVTDAEPFSNMGKNKYYVQLVTCSDTRALIKLDCCTKLNSCHMQLPQESRGHASKIQLAQKNKSATKLSDNQSCVAGRIVIGQLQLTEVFDKQLSGHVTGSVHVTGI